MSSANVDAMVQAAVRAYRGGEKEEARQLLEKATELDPMHEQAWMWMSAVVESPEDQRTCLENVLYINPNNENAKRGLKMLPATDSAAPAAAKSEPEPEIEETPADDEYFVPTSSSSGVFAASNEPSGEELDDWVAGLNLGSDDDGSAVQSTAQAEPAPSDSSFLDDDTYNSLFSSAFDESEEYEPDEDIPAANTQSPFSDDFGGLGDDDAGVYEFEQDVFDDDAFGFDDDDNDIFGVSDFGTDGPFSAGVDLDLPASEPTTTHKRRPASPTSPVEGRPTKSPTSSSGALYEGDSFDIDEPDPGVYFRRIPKGIKTTRLPGEREKAPIVHIAAVLLLLLLNVGAVGILMTSGG